MNELNANGVRSESLTWFFSLFSMHMFAWLHARVCGEEKRDIEALQMRLAEDGGDGDDVAALETRF